MALSDVKKFGKRLKIDERIIYVLTRYGWQLSRYKTKMNSVKSKDIFYREHISKLIIIVEKIQSSIKEFRVEVRRYRNGYGAK